MAFLSTTTCLLSEEQMHAYVEAGAKHLDDIRPGWFKQIKRSRLNMAVCGDCIIGQLYGTYSKKVQGLSDLSKERMTLGFIIPVVVESHPAWDVLKEAWLVQIDKRLAEAGLLLGTL